MLKKRRAKRLAYKTAARVYREDKRSSHIVGGYLLETKDINEKGLFLRTKEPFKKGTQLYIKITLEPLKRPLSIKGEVTWVTERKQRQYYPGIGVRIVEIGPADKKRLKEFLKRKFQSYKHALELKDMYIKLKQIGARLFELEELHPHAQHFRKVIDKAVTEIDKIAHIINKEIWEIKSL